MKSKFKNYLTFPLILVGAMLFFLLWPSGGYQAIDDEGVEVMRGEVVNVIVDNGAMQTLEVIINSGSREGQKIQIKNDDSLLITPRKFTIGDKVIVENVILSDGADNLYISEYDRSGALFWLFAIFLLVVILVASWQGLGSIVGMFFSFLILFKFVLPGILDGADPVNTAILGALFIIPATFYSSHGFARKTTVAVAGTILTLVITGLLATFFADLAHLSGLASDETAFLKLDTAHKIDFSGLVLAGMIISILGILDDITISQASVVQQLKNAKEKISFKELYFRAMSVGRDHISSMVNTLILVYTGASLPLLILFLDRSRQFMEVISYEFLTEEIIRTLIGSIGLILAVPVTTLLACVLLRHDKSDATHVHHHH